MTITKPRQSDYWVQSPRARKHSLPGVTLPTRICSKCGHPKPLAGGTGSSRPWKCASCK